VVVQTKPGTLTQFAITPAGVAERWTFPGPDDDQRLQAIYATPVLRNGQLIVAGFSGDLLALDATSGRPVEGWGGKLEGKVVADPVAVDDAHMFFATDHGTVQSVDLSTGTIFDSKAERTERVYGAGARADGRVYYASLDKQMFALNAATAEQVWETAAGPALSSVVVNGESLIVGALDSRVRAYSAADGSERWAFRGEEWFWATPLVSANNVLAVDLDGRVYAIDGASGTERWRSTGKYGNVRANPVLAGGVLVIATSEGSIVGLDPGTGEERWALQSTAGKLLASPLVLESGILFVSDSGALLRVDPRAGTQETLYTPK
jgi:outer membrane protein assembly factor BamB